MRKPGFDVQSGNSQPTQQIDFRTIWTASGSPIGVGYPLIIFLLLYPVVIGWPQEPPAELALDLNFHIFDLLSGIGTALTVLLLRFVVRAIPQGNLRTTVIVLGWYVAGLMGGVLQYAVARSVGYLSPFYDQLLPLSGFTFWALSFCFTCFVYIAIQNRQRTTELAQATSRLQFLQETIGIQVAHAQDQLHKDVTEKINPVLESLSAEVEQLVNTSSDDSLSATTQQLRTAAVNVIRPLSHELYSADAEVELDRSSVAVPRVMFRDFFTRRMNVNVVFSASLPAILILAFFTGSYYIGAGWVGVIGGNIAATAVVVVILTLLYRLTSGLQLNAVVVVFIGLVVRLLLSTLYVLIPTMLNIEIQEDYLLFIGMGAALVLMGTSLASVVYDNWQYAINRTKEANDENAALVARSRQEVWLRQKQIAKLVHGSVQSRLNAARIRLTQATTITPELVDSVRADLESARKELSLPPRQQSTDIRSQLSELSDFWRGVCDILYSVDEHADASLSRDPTATQAVMEVVSEGVSNSVKHSHATQVHLTIAQASAMVLSMRLEHSVPVSASSAPPASSGLGTQILNQLTLSWTFDIEEGEACLQAEIPVSR